MLLVLCSLLAVIESPSSSAHDTGHTPLIVQYHVWEEQPSGTRVGRLLDDLRQSGETGSLGSFQLVHRSSLPITVATRDGTVSTLGRLDREDLCRGDEACEISFSVLYQKNGAMRFLSVHVQVMDLNDNSPLFPRPRQDVEISETVSLRMRFPLDLAVDSDAGANGLQTYSLSPNPHFALDVRTSGGAKQAELIVIKELDRELQPTLELVLTAWDKGNPPKSGTTSILVTVIDSNDNSPVFEDTPFAIELAEDTVRGTVVVNVHASDPDQGANGEVEYSLSKLTPLDVKRLFSIHPKSGALTVQGPLDFEEKSLYEVDIQARDLGPNAIPSHHKLQIKLQDVNDNAPRIHLTWTPSESPFATVSEGAPNETFLALVMVSDADSGTNGQVQVEIRSVSGHFRLKHIHADNYMIVTNDALDRERQMDYNLTLLTQDNGSPPLSCVKYLNVRVLDENDNAPVFTKTHYHSVVKENNIAGFRFLTVEAQDVDLDLSGRVSFSIKETNDLETPMGFFSVNSASGALSVQQPLDYEESRSYSFIVEAVDHGYPPMTSSTTVLVEVQDVNDNYPIVTDPPTKEGLALVSVPVNLDRGEIVTELGNRIVDDKCRNHSCAIKPRGFLAKTIQAKDLDSGLNGQLTFEITDALPFNIFLLDRHSGQLYVNTTNATEWIGRTFKVGIAVSDMGEPTLTTKTAMEVTFVNLRDHLKNLSRDGRPRYSLTMLVAICLGSTFLFLVLVVGVTKTFCHPDKRDNRAYNCRQAESLYTCHPRRPQKLIQKTDIHLVSALRGPSQDPARDRAQAVSSTPPLLDTPNPQCQFAFPPDFSPSHSDSELDGNLPLTPSRILKKPGSIEWNGALPYNSLYRSPHNSRTSSSSSHANSQGGTLKRDRKAKPPHMYPRETTASVSSNQATLRRPKTSDRRVTTEPDHRQILRNLVRLSMAMFAENGDIELSSASPEVQQVSQLLSLLHQGKLQPRPNFRGNKFSHRTARAGPQEADWLSTKDSGHGESEMGDVEWDTDSPVDGLSQLLVSDDVFADAPDPAWMARLSLPMAADYHENLFVPDHAPAADSSASFSTFGKSPEKRLGGGALMCDVSSLFEMLLTQKADAQSRPPADVLYRLSAAWRRLETATPPRDPAS